MKNRFILRDSVLSVLSRLLLIGCIQFVIFPRLLSQVGEVRFGEILTYVAILNMISLGLGSVLNNTYLILSKDIASIPLKRNMTYLFIWLLMLNVVLVVYAVYSSNLRPGAGEISLLLLASAILLYNTYWTVNYRVDLDYISALKDSLLVAVGYFVGYILFILTDLWILIYFVGFLFGFGFLTFKYGVLPLFNTAKSHIREIFQKFSWLLTSGLLLSLGTYIDRIILFPRMGGEAVGYYYVASLMPKSIGMIVGPVAGVLLSYLVKKSNTSTRSFVSLLIAALVLAFFAYLIIMGIDGFVLERFYPDLAEISLEYTPTISLGILLLIVSNVLNTTILSSKNLMYQVVINGLYLFVYIIASIYLLGHYGLNGFCFAITVASLFKLVSVIVVFFHGKTT